MCDLCVRLINIKYYLKYILSSIYNVYDNIRIPLIYMGGGGAYISIIALTLFETHKLYNELCFKGGRDIGNIHVYYNITISSTICLRYSAPLMYL